MMIITIIIINYNIMIIIIILLFYNNILDIKIIITEFQMISRTST